MYRVLKEIGKEHISAERDGMTESNEVCSRQVVFKENVAVK